MTLYRQLLAYACIVLICLSTGLWIGELTRTRNFLSDQLESHAQDTATSLGLSLSTLTDGRDIATMESMVNALFDRGYYRLIRLHDLDGHVLVDRTATIKAEGVPAWFITLLPLHTPNAQALLMHGWQQTGTVTVESHPGYAYTTLWRSALTATLSFVLAVLVTALLGALGLRRLLHPLNAIEEQALALTERRFHLQRHLPRTRELRRVVIAMNTMTERIRDMFHEQTAIADDLMQRAYQDGLTSLGNRRYLEAQIQAKVTTKGRGARGVFLLAQVRDLHQHNQVHGYEAGDQLLRQTADILRQACSDIGEPIIARLGGGDFALLLPNIEQNEAQRIGDTLSAFHAGPEDEGGYSLACGGVVYVSAVSAQILLTTADQALASARHRGDRITVLEILGGADDFNPMGRQARKSMLEAMLRERAIVLYSQPTVNQGDLRDIVHHEILTRMIDPEGTHISIGAFIPVAEQFGLMPALDRLILERLLEMPLQSLEPRRLAINLSPLSLTDNDFMAWFQPWIERCTAMGIALNFEFPEFQAVRHRTAITAFAAQVKQRGHGLGIDHFGLGLLHFGYLKSLLPDYVKIDRGITQDLWNEQGDSYFFVNALCNVAHSLDIRVMVEGVETEQQWRAISRIHLDAVQGFLIQRPEPLQPGPEDHNISLTIS
jgi:diguanylate cyclase (GGDEF)-like protein